MLPLRRPVCWATTLSLVVGILVLSGRVAQATEALTPLTKPVPHSFQLRLAEQATDDDTPAAKDKDDPLLTKPVVVDTEPTPYWKTWWFWTATGLGVVTIAVATSLALSFKPDIHACPDFYAQGCYGEGR